MNSECDLSSTLHEIDPDTVYGVSISISLGFPYMVYAFPCFPYMVMLPEPLNIKAIVLDMALLWTLNCLKGCYCDITMIRWLLFHGICIDLSGRPSTPIVDCQSINYLLDFKVICCVSPLNNSIYIIGCNCRLGRVLGVFNKCSGLRPSDTLSSCKLGWHRHALTGKQWFVKLYDLSFQSIVVDISTHVCLYWIKGIFCGYAIQSGRLPSGCLPDRIV